jgi:hypothetical protein
MGNWRHFLSFYFIISFFFCIVLMLFLPTFVRCVAFWWRLTKYGVPLGCQYIQITPGWVIILFIFVRLFKNIKKKNVPMLLNILFFLFLLLKNRNYHPAHSRVEWHFTIFI